MSDSDNTLHIEVAYGVATKQSLVPITVPEGTTVEQAIVASKLLDEYPEINLSKNKVGIWSRVVRLTDTVKEGDRIEIYRPLIADPKEIRKRRAEKAKEEGRADKVTGGRPNPLKART